MLKYLLTTISVFLLSLAIFWYPFYFHQDIVWGIETNKGSMQTVASNYDALNFLVVARSWYNPEIITSDYSALIGERGVGYFAAHYPIYAMEIGFFDYFTTGTNAILLSIILNNVLLAIGLFYFFREFVTDKKWLVAMTIIASFIPARILALRGVGSNEPLLILFSLLSLLFSVKKRDFLAGLLGALAVLTRSPAILLFVAYFIHFASGAKKRLIPYMLMPLALILLFCYFGYVYGDFWAYFKVGGNINLSWPPFLVFGSNLDWVSGNWLEDLVYTYGFYLAGVVLFLQKYSLKTPYRVIGIYALTYLVAIMFVVHRDIARYATPIAPIALVGYLANTKIPKYWWLMLILIIPIYLYSWNYILNNVQAVADWTRLQ